MLITLKIFHTFLKKLLSYLHSSNFTSPKSVLYRFVSAGIVSHRYSLLRSAKSNYIWRAQSSQRTLTGYSGELL